MIDEPISEFMNATVLRGDESTPLREVVSKMHIERQSAFIVCDGETPVGVISELDAVAILSAMLEGECFDHICAGDIMASPVRTLQESASMGEVIQVMKDRHFRRVPIVNDKNELTGIVNLTDLQSAMNGALERRGRDLEVAVMVRTAELQAANAKLEQLSLRDGLTGMLNRRAMELKLNELHGLCKRYSDDYAIILLDIDHFKLFNDGQGHVEGDSVLRQVGTALKSSIRISDSVYRYGGEEFLAVLPHTDDAGAGLIADRMRTNISDLKISHPDSTTAEFITVSLGYTHVDGETARTSVRWEPFVERADSALYIAKENGRNQAIAWDGTNAD